MRFGRTLVWFIGLTVILLSGGLWLKTGLAFNTNRIAFTFYSQPDFSDVYVMDADGGNRENLTNNPAYDYDPDWSPDGTKIAFTSTRNGGSQIFVMDADGKNQIELTDGPRYKSTPDWSPDGTKIAFTVDDREDYIAVMDADGENRERLIDQAREPSWSPDGSEIAFMSRRAGGQSYHIYVIDADGQGLRRVTHHLSGAERPAFSPDGKRIAYQAKDESFSHIFMVNADGTDPKRLTQNQQNHGDPAWSPGGKRIAYTFFRDPNRDGASTIHLMTADGQYLELLSAVDDAYDSQPDFLPVGLAVSPTSKAAATWGRLKKLAPELP
ncbi:MAG: DPP IV N-terminal domain-containing protein [Candidatus Poribacteria bacterium]|nr:DPP IV N-terminal domain-containing protein [Candidatus Poribacteria bacterium]MDE0505651.1 DPP IV N-terminal domain-containing protein [Candidatus Poribacteria bacterium]